MLSMNSLTTDDFVRLYIFPNEWATYFAVAPVVTDGTVEAVFDLGESTNGYIKPGFMLSAVPTVNS